MRVDRLLDNNFLVNRWRGGSDSGAAKWLRQNHDLVIALPWVVKGEFLRGSELARHDRGEVREFLAPYPTLWPDNALLEKYAALFAELRRRNLLLGPHDLWIAAAALHADTPLVTRNTTEFSRVPGLKVDPY